jgi:hypothetical protein
LLKRLTFLVASLAPFVAVAAIATTPTAHAAYYCRSGTPTAPTPSCFYYCKVPSVVGLKLHAAAVPTLHAHDCRVKTHFPKKKKGRKIKRYVVTKQSVGTGSSEPYAYKVGIYVKDVYYPVI